MTTILRVNALKVSEYKKGLVLVVSRRGMVQSLPPPVAPTDHYTSYYFTYIKRSLKMSFLDLQDELSAAEMKKKTKEMKVRVVKVIHIT